jgi:outer membrane protein TolC
MALANNLELQAARIEELTKKAIEYSNRTKMLPHFLFTGDLNERDNQQYTFSDVIGAEGLIPQPGAGGAGVNVFSTGRERSQWRWVLETRWTPTDAALAYYLSKSSANDGLKAHYQKLRVAQKLISQVDGAFFRLLVLQKCVCDARQLAATRAAIAEKMKRAYDKKLVQVNEYDRVKQQAIKAQRLEDKILNEMEKQRNILASVMGLSPDVCIDGGFCVVGDVGPPCFNMCLSDMEMQAVQNRPEAFEAGLNHLNAINDFKRTIVKYFPRATGFWRTSADKDHYMYNKNWKEVGVTVYFDLLDWLANWNESGGARSNAVKTEREMGAIALGIASQVRVAALTHHDSMSELRSTQASLQGSREVLAIATEKADKEDLDKLALEEARANVIQGTIELARAVGEANATLAELQGTMGINYHEPPPVR